MRKIKILVITLVIALITMIGFFGIYVNVQNRMEDKVKDYSYAMDLEGTRNIRLKVDTQNKTTIKDAEGKEVTDTENLTDEQIAENGYTKEETPYNNPEDLNAENYKKSKKVIEKRLEKLGVENYTIKLDEQTGDIIVELTENNNTDTIISNLYTVGKFEIVDSETNEVLMNNDDIKLANVMYGSGSSSGTTSSGTSVYLNIEFTKEGSKKLEDISGKYVKTEAEATNETTDETSEETSETTEKKITMKVDDEEIMSTSFDEPLRTGKLQLSIGTASTDNKTIQGYVEQASSMSTVLDTGKMPVKYTIEGNEYILSDITDNELQIVGYVILAVTVLALIILVIRYKTRGLLGAISYIGLISIFVLVIRYANVILSIEGLFAIALIMILNYIFINKMLSKIKNNKELNKTKVNVATKETYKEFFIKIVPIIIAVISFAFIKWIPISSFGMVMFWGIALIALYNFIITSNLLKLTAKEGGIENAKK